MLRPGPPFRSRVSWFATVLAAAKHLLERTRLLISCCTFFLAAVQDTTPSSSMSRMLHTMML